MVGEKKIVIIILWQSLIFLRFKQKVLHFVHLFTLKKRETYFLMRTTLNTKINRYSRIEFKNKQ